MQREGALAIVVSSAVRPDAVCLGESMVTFLPTAPGRLADVPAFTRSIGGAESNVACTLARAGHRTRWVSRVGADGFGDHLVRTIAAAGVDTGAVVRDPYRPTGVYFRTDGERATGLCEAGAEAPAAGASGPCAAGRGEVAYYRAGSAASAMSPENTDLAAADAGRVLHLTGITAALSADCLRLLRALTAPRPARPLLSFDVNYRVGLWRSPAETRVLRDLARRCDLVFVGEDEAEAVWGVRGGPAAVRAALPEPAAVVVKQGSRGATAFVRGDAAFDGDASDGDAHDGDASGGAAAAVQVPAPRVAVVAHVGAGDAFAAGYLSATLRGLPVRDRLRHGHLWAAAALTVPGDLAPPPVREHADRLAALPDDSWAALRLASGWTRQTPAQEAPVP